MKKSSARIITIVFLCFMPLWMIFCKDRAFSQKENRNLASFPKFKWAAVTGGAFMDDFETYLSDQFPIRDLCVSVKTTILRMTGRKLINDVYIASDGYLIAKESEMSEKKVQQITDAINYFSTRMENVKVNLMLVPNASLIYETKLPMRLKSTEKNTMEFVEENLFSSVNYINVYDTLKEHKKEGLYYKTDHHWNTTGAYYAFLQYAKEMGISPVEYKFYNITNSFQGTQASNSGIYSTYESVALCVPNTSVNSYVVKFTNEDRKTTTLFDKEKLEEKDKYQVFLGGNYAEVEILTNAGTGKNLLLVKDSYANCFIPMLTPYYDKIIVIDPRYFYDDIYSIARINKINEALFLYNVNSYVDDNSLADILVKNN